MTRENADFRFEMLCEDVLKPVFRAIGLSFLVKTGILMILYKMLIFAMVY